MFKRGKSDDRQVSLPEERKALAERYTIDAEEAETRAQRAAERARLEAEEQARRDVRRAEELARREAEARARRKAEAHAQREAAAKPAMAAVDAPVEVHLHGETERATGETEPPPADADEVSGRPEENLPVYGWVQRVEPAEPAGGDWPRELVRAKEGRKDEDRRT